MRTQLSRLEAAFGAAIQVKNFGRSEKLIAECEFSKLVEVAAWLRMEESCRMDFLESFTIFEAKGKFVFNFFIRSHPNNLQLVLRTTTMAPGPKEWVKVPSMIGVWPGAEPFESELGPLFGIEFTGAPTERGVRKNFGNFSGFPLRKGFEWHGEIDP